MRREPDRLWIIKVTYVTLGTIRLQSVLPKAFHRFELICDTTTSSFPSSHQHLTESDKIAVNFALTESDKIPVTSLSLST